MQKELVSIVTPMYNGSEFIQETIDTVLDQSYMNWEMIVIDDGSSDKGMGIDVVERYMKDDSRIRLIVSKQNQGSSGARNKGIKAARGNIIAFLDSDDLWDTVFLDKQLRFMQEKNAVFVFSSYKRIDEQTKKEILSPFIVPERVNYKQLLKSVPIFPSTVLINIGKLGKHYLNEQLGSLRDDYAFWLYLLKYNVNYAYGNKEILASYRLRRNSVTSSKSGVIIPHWNLLRDVEGFSCFESFYYMCCWAWTSLLKYNK